MPLRLGSGLTLPQLDFGDHVFQGHIPEQIVALGRVVAIAHRKLADKTYRVHQADFPAQHANRVLCHLSQWFRFTASVWILASGSAADAASPP